MIPTTQSSQKANSHHIIYDNVPLVAYGTWVENLDDASAMLNRVETAISVGYTHIDTAKNYGTEIFAIQAIIASDINRDAIFLTSKVGSFIDPEILRADLGALQYYDLLLLHYPPFNTRSRMGFKMTIRNIWGNMQSYIHKGIAKHIGVSNFYQNHLELLIEVCEENGFIPPLVNQIEIHVGNLELAFVPYMQNHGIIPFAHTSLGGLGSNYLLDNDILITICNRIGATPAQVILAYLLKRQIGVITSSENYHHMNDSIHASKFIDSLTLDDIDSINSTDGFGPMIISSISALEDNMLLY